MWIQTDGNGITNWYKATDCTNVFNEKDLPAHVYDEIRDKKCPQMDDNNILLQANSHKEGRFTGKQFRFIVDLCSNLQEHSG